MNTIWINCKFEGTPPTGYESWLNFVNSKVKSGVKITTTDEEKNIPVDNPQDLDSFRETSLEYQKKQLIEMEQQTKALNSISDTLFYLLKHIQERY